MANTFGILAAVALLFGLFVSYKNKEHLTLVNDSIATEERNKATNTKNYEGLLADISALDEETAGYDSVKESTQTKLDDQKAANVAIEKKIASAKTDADVARSKADAADEKLKEVGDISEIIPEMKALEASITQLEDDISVNTSVVDRLEGSKSTAKSKADALAAQLSQRVSGESYFKTTSIRSVFSAWGFVTLAGGDKIGVVKKSKLSVRRGGEEIAQLIVTGVEPNSAAASIIPTSVKDDVTVSSGDTVVPLEEDKAVQ